MTVTKNTLVTLNYRLTDSRGQLLNTDNEPLIYLHGGHGQIFKAVELALEGKGIGESVQLTLVPAEAFGDYDETLLVEEALDDLPEGITVGMEIEAEEEGHLTVYTIAEINEEYALLDANHPLAGESLTFEGTIKDLQPMNEEAVREILSHHHSH